MQVVVALIMLRGPDKKQRKSRDYAAEKEKRGARDATENEAKKRQFFGSYHASKQAQVFFLVQSV